MGRKWEPLVSKIPSVSVRLTLGLSALILGGGVASSRAIAQEINARSYGARSGWQGDQPTITRKAIRQALSAPYYDPDTGEAMTQRTVYLPGKLWVDRPIHQPSRSWLRGDVGLSQIQSTGGWPPVVLGLKVDPNGQVLTPDNFLDLSKRWDGSQKGIPPFGTWGYHTRGNSALFSPGSILSLGPQPGGWPSLSILTLDTWIVADKPLLGGPLMGIVDGPDPLSYIWDYDADYNRFWFKVRTTDKNDKDPRTHTFEWTGPNSGDLETTIEVNLSLGEFHVAMSDGTAGSPLIERTILPTSQPNGFGAGRKLVENDLRSHWCFAAASKVIAPSDYYARASTKTGFNDLGLAGHSAWGVRRYAWNGAGKPISRPDGQPITDYYRYLYVAPGVLYVLPLYDPPDEITADRFLRAWSPTGDQPIWFLSPAHGSNWASTTDQRISGLILKSGSGGGPALMTGLNLNTTLEDVSAIGSGYGIMAFPIGANYITRMNRVEVAGDIASLHAYWSTLGISDLTVSRCGKYGLYLNSCSSDINRVFFPEVGSPRSLFKIIGGEAGGLTLVRNVMSDFEGGQHPSDSLASIGIGRNVPENYIHFEGVTSANLPDSAVDFDLGDGQPGEGKYPATIRIDGYAAYSRRAPRVKTSGPLWNVRIEGVEKTPQPQPASMTPRPPRGQRKAG
jgi:hypothetical protein